jgi:hypothetical protein
MPTTASPALSLLPQAFLPTTVGPVPPYRPDLRVLEGGRAPARLARAAAYQRRRAVALALLATALVAAYLLVGAVSTRFAGGGDPSSAVGNPSPTSAVALRAAEVAATSWVVAPGDTLWSIAADIAPEADVRATVQQLVELNGSSPIVVGQQLVLPDAG